MIYVYLCIILVVPTDEGLLPFNLVACLPDPPAFLIIAVYFVWLVRQPLCMQR